MKNIFLGLFLSHGALASPIITKAPVEHLYLPKGFDSNDSVEVVITGSFPDPCHARNKVDVLVREDFIDISVTAISHERDKRSDCIAMVVPFKEVVSLGNLQGGNYDVRVNRGSQSELNGKLVIEEASSSSVDDHIYAAIDYVDRRGKEEFVLQGWSYSDCFVLDKVRVLDNGKDTLSVLPIMKKVRNFCPMKGARTSYPVKLDFGPLRHKDALIHVRTLDGKSVNSIIKLDE